MRFSQFCHQKLGHRTAKFGRNLWQVLLYEIQSLILFYGVPFFQIIFLAIKSCHPERIIGLFGVFAVSKSLKAFLKTWESVFSVSLRDIYEVENTLIVIMCV